MAILCWRPVGAQPSKDNNEVFVVAVIYAEGPPLYSIDPISGQPVGILTDFLEQLSKAMNLQIVFLPTARKKIEEQLVTNQADAAFLAPQWVLKPAELVFTDTVLIHRQYFYSLAPFTPGQAGPGNIEDSLRGKAVCIRQDFLYPELNELFGKKLIVRTNVSSQDKLMDMLVENHCELIYMNDLRAQWALNNQALPRRVFRSPYSFAEDKVPLALSSKWAPRLQEFNKQIRILHQTGEIQRIIERNTKADTGVVSANR